MDDEVYRAVQEQAHQLTELEKHPGWVVFVDYLYAATEPDRRAALSGAFTDINRYQKVAGKLLGVQVAIDAPQAVREMVLGEHSRREERRLAELDES